jgi:hypothetical protein
VESGKYYTNVELVDNDQHSILLCSELNTGLEYKTLRFILPGANVTKLFTSVIYDFS